MFRGSNRGGGLCGNAASASWQIAAIFMFLILRGETCQEPRKSANETLLVLPFAVEWHIPVGCGFSGFYVEFLGLVSYLEQVLPELRVVRYGS